MKQWHWKYVTITISLTDVTAPSTLVALLTAMTALWLMLAVGWLWPTGMRALAAVGTGLLISILGATLIGIDGFARLWVRVRLIEFDALDRADKAEAEREEAVKDRDYWYREAQAYAQRHAGVISRLTSQTEQLAEHNWREQMKRWGLPPTEDETDGQ